MNEPFGEFVPNGLYGLLASMPAVSARPPLPASIPKKIGSGAAWLTGPFTDSRNRK